MFYIITDDAGVRQKSAQYMNKRMVLVLSWTLFELSVKNLKKSFYPSPSGQRAARIDLNANRCVKKL